MFYSMDLHISKKNWREKGGEIGIITGFLAAIWTVPRSVEDISLFPCTLSGP